MNRREGLVAGLGLAALAAGEASAQTGGPSLTLAFSARVKVGAALETGVIDGVRRRIIPILGGTFEGPGLKGEVLPGGADWQGIGTGGFTKIYARYTLKTSDGAIIGVENPGVRRGPPEVIAKLAAGERVDPSLYYFRTSPVFEVGPGPYRWLAESVFVGVGKRWPEDVEIEFYRVG